jgi:hypothetical protein
MHEISRNLLSAVGYSRCLSNSIRVIVYGPRSRDAG